MGRSVMGLVGAILCAWSCAAPPTYSCDERVRPEVERVLGDICDRTGRCYVRVPSDGDIDVAVSDAIEGEDHLAYTSPDGHVQVRPSVVAGPGLLQTLYHELGHTQDLQHRDDDPKSAMHTHVDLRIVGYSDGDWAAMR